MATDIENLRTRRSRILQILADGEVTGSDNEGVSIDKPTYTADGQSVSWNEYRRSLLEELKMINELLPTLEPSTEIDSNVIA